MSCCVIDPVELTRALIRCKSVTPADDGALDIVANTLKESGFTIHELPFDGDGSYPVRNIFARIGNEAPHLCFLGHTDVVPPGNEADWSHPPFAAEIDDGILYGRGAADMKSGVACAIAAACNFIGQNTDFKGSISLLITGDEEADAVNGTIKVIQWMKENSQIPDAALVAEPSNPETMGQMMRVGRRGSYHADIIATGKQGHSAYPDRFINPIDKLVKLLAAVNAARLDNGTDLMPPSHIAVTNIHVGNMADNVVPARASAHINIRFNDSWTADKLTEKLHAILKASGEDYELAAQPCNAESFMSSSTAWMEIVAKAVEKISGTRPLFDTGGGTSDGRFIAPYCPVVEYGVITKTNHQVDENMKVADIETLAATYGEILRSYLK